jgi:two-component system phosphate regulon response regulator PhoB
VRILITEDDEALAEALQFALTRAGYAVDHVATGTAADAALKRDDFGLLILDLGLPMLDGFEVLKRLRRRNRTLPVLILSGRERAEHKVMGLDLGADDYVVKPFLSREFAARVRSSLRRSRSTRGAVYRFDTLEIRVDSREVTVDGRPVALSRREFDLLAYLAGHAGQAIPRDRLLRDVWQSSDAWQDTATVTEHIRRVRLKIEPDPGKPRWIQGVRNVGYRLEPGSGPEHV